MTARGARRSYPTLDATRHAVYRLGAGLLLVYKPRGHRESEHAHSHRQRLRVLRGALRIETARRVLTLDGSGDSLTLAAGRRHATEALADTWLVAETLGGPDFAYPTSATSERRALASARRALENETALVRPKRRAQARPRRTPM